MRRARWLGAFMIVLLGACTAGDPGPGAARSPGSTAGSTLPRPAESTPPAPGEIDCDHSIATMPAPTPGTRIVLGVVALPTNVLQAVPMEGRFWSKRGLEVLAGVVVEISVAPEAAGHAEIGWGSPGQPGTSLRVNGCSALGGGAVRPWLAFAGGYWVDSPACVPIVVRSNGRAARVRVAVGVACG